MSVREALKHAAIANGVELNLSWIHSTDLEDKPIEQVFEEIDGIIVPGGFGSRGVEGKINTACFARENKVPYLGLCLGLQVMVIEYARNVLGLSGANSSEFDSMTPAPVIHLMPEQNDIDEKGGTMRLGLYPCLLQEGSKARDAYQTDQVEERHRHRFELNNDYRAELESAGLICSGISPDNRLVEITEVQNHPFMLGTQFHPEFLSRPNRPHPLFDAFLRAVKDHKADQAKAK